MWWRISYSPHAAGTDRGNPRDAGEVYACQVFPLLFFTGKGLRKCSPLFIAFIQLAPVRTPEIASPILGRYPACPDTAQIVCG